VTTVDNFEREQRRQMNDSPATVSSGDKYTYSSRQHLTVKPSGRSTHRSTSDRHAVQTPTGYAVDGRSRVKRQQGGVDQSSDSDTRVRFAPDTNDDSTSDDRRPSYFRRPRSNSGTLPARLRGPAGQQMVLEFDQRDAAGGRSLRRATERPRSALFDTSAQAPVPVGSSAAAMTGSVPTINAVHRGNSTSISRARQQPASRRVVDSNIYTTSVRYPR